MQSDNRVKRLLIVAGLIVGVVIVLAVISLALNRKVARDSLQSFGNAWYSVSYPKEFQEAGTINTTFATAPNDPGLDKDWFTIERYGQTKDLPDSSNFSTIIGSTAEQDAANKVSTATINGRQVLSTQTASDNGNERVYYVFDDEYVWRFTFHLADSKTLTDTVITSIMQSFSPKPVLEQLGGQ